MSLTCTSPLVGTIRSVSRHCPDWRGGWPGPPIKSWCSRQDRKQFRRPVGRARVMPANSFRELSVWTSHFFIPSVFRQSCEGGSFLYLVSHRANIVTVLHMTEGDPKVKRFTGGHPRKKGQRQVLNSGHLAPGFTCIACEIVLSDARKKACCVLGA